MNFEIKTDKNLQSHHNYIMAIAQKTIEWLPEEVKAFSPLQMQICEARSNSISTNYSELAMKFGLTSQSSISTCIKRTISGYYWDEKTGGGQLAYLSDTKTIQFFEKVDQYGADLNCLKTIQAYSIAYELRHDQYLKAFYLLDKMNIKFHNYKGLPGDLQRFVNSLSPYPPSEQWLYHFAKSIK